MVPVWLSVGRELGQKKHRIKAAFLVAVVQHTDPRAWGFYRELLMPAASIYQRFSINHIVCTNTLVTASSRGGGNSPETHVPRGQPQVTLASRTFKDNSLSPPLRALFCTDRG